MKSEDAKKSPDRVQLLILVLLTAAVSALNGYDDAFNTFNATHWLFNYEAGFVKRAVVGEALSVFTNTPSRWLLSLVNALVASFVAVVFAFLCFRMVETIAASGPVRPDALTLYGVCAMLLTSPGTIQQFFYDIGRFDAIGFLFACLSLLAVMRMEATTALLAVSSLSLGAVLVHEAFFFWIGPLGLGLWTYHHGVGRRSLPWLFMSAAALVALTWIVGNRTYEDVMSFDAAAQSLQERTDFEVADLSLMVHFRSFSENIEYNSARAISNKRFLSALLAGAFLSLYAAAIVFCSRHDRLKRVIFLILPSMAPLALLGLGLDHGRWFAMVNCGLVLSVLACLKEAGWALRRLPPWQLTGALYLMATTQIVIGPFGVLFAFPESNIWWLASAILGSMGIGV